MVGDLILGVRTIDPIDMHVTDSEHEGVEEYPDRPIHLMLAGI
jgi:hypothetical protein